MSHHEVALDCRNVEEHRPIWFGTWAGELCCRACSPLVRPGQGFERRDGLPARPFAASPRVEDSAVGEADSRDPLVVGDHSRQPHGVRRHGHVHGWAKFDGTWTCVQEHYAVGFAPATRCGETWEPMPLIVGLLRKRSDGNLSPKRKALLDDGIKVLLAALPEDERAGAFEIALREADVDHAPEPEALDMAAPDTRVPPRNQ